MAAGVFLFSQPAEVHFTLQILRKDTGKIETVEMVGHVDPEATKKLNEEKK